MQRPKPLPVVRPKPPVAFDSPWKTEQEWLVDFIVRDLAGTAAYAATGRAPRPEDLEVRVSQAAARTGTSPSVRVGASLTLEKGQPPRTAQEELRLTPHLWAPEQYQGIARAFLGTDGPPSAAAAAAKGGGERLLKALLDLRAATLIRENRALSERLKASPRDAEAHEDAALLVGAFALRDEAYWLVDTRPALCRMTAHLALAAVFGAGKPPGVSARYAQAIQLTLVERQKEALDLLAELERSAGPAAEQAAWIRALRLRTTGDWRLSADVPRLTLLEKQAEFRAQATMIDPSAAVARLDTRGAPEAIPAWGRILIGVSAPVEAGQRFGMPTLAMEMQEVQEAWKSLREGPLPEDTLADALNEPPGPLVSRDAKGETRLEVLDWGAWASSGQRHILHEVRGYQRFMERALAQKEASKAFGEQARGQFGGLLLYPTFMASLAEDAATYRAGMSAARSVAFRSPERVTPGCWVLLRTKFDFAPIPKDLPDQTSWFDPPEPSGTLLNWTFRLEYLPALMGASAEERRRLREMAPYHVHLAEVDYQKSGAWSRPRDPAQLAKAFGPSSEYSTGVMRLMAQAAWYDTPAYRRYAGRLCDLQPYACFELGSRLAQLHLDDEAAIAYQRGFDQSQDRVGASNNSRWLVDYYFDHGQEARALGVAKQALEVGSWSGIFTMARLMERMGRLDEAELYYGQLLHRYDNKNELLGFFYRRAIATKDPTYERRFQNMKPEVFPAGLDPIDRPKLTSPPRDGVVVRGENDNTLGCGLKFGHVIVGLDGFRVRNLEEYSAVLALSQSPDMTLLVWRGKTYDEVKVSLWERLFYVQMRDFKPGAK